MKKKLFRVIAIVALLALCVTALAACNAYKWDSIGSGDSSAAPVSNGGYFVKQGGYAYFVNGYVGESTDGNAWGAAVKGSIVRASVKEDGSIDSSTAKVVVPENVYTTTSGTGIAIFGEWIYYAAYNYDKDKNGEMSTTDLDFMRTRNDGAVTQKIGTISSRTANYKFTPSRVLYVADNTISYFDFSGMKGDKSSKKCKGVTSGTLAENVTSVAWNYAEESVAGSIDEYVFYTQSLTGTESYKNYNKLCVVKYDGTDSKVLATETSYLSNSEKPEETPLKVFKFSLVGIYYDDANTATLYYTKSFYKDSTDTNCGLFCNQYKDGTFDVSKEKQLNSIASTTVFPLGYEKGALAYNSDNIYCWYNGSNASDPVQVNESASAKVWKVEGNYAYFTASDAEELFKINYTEKSNVESVVVTCIKADWYPIEFYGDMMYYFYGDDNNYIYAVNLTAVDEEKPQGTMIGIYAEGDKPSEDTEEK